MLIYLCRHGIAAEFGESGARTDAERPLTSDGLKKLREAAKGYRKAVERPRRLFTSTLLRARQTGQALGEIMGIDALAEETPLLVPEADPARTLAWLQAELCDQQNPAPLLLVGHEPHLGELLGLLLTSTQRTSIPFKKGMIVGVEIEEPQTMVGRLVLALTQREGRDLG